MAHSVMDEVAAAKRAIAEGNDIAKHAEDTTTDPAPTPPEPAPAKEETGEDTPPKKEARTPEEVDAVLDDHEARIAVLEEAIQTSTEENATLTGALEEATATIQRLAAVLRDPAKAQALARGETAPAMRKAEPPAQDALTTYLALKPGSAEAAAYYKAHAAEIAALANRR